MLGKTSRFTLTTKINFLTHGSIQVCTRLSIRYHRSGIYAVNKFSLVTLSDENYEQEIISIKRLRDISCYFILSFVYGDENHTTQQFIGRKFIQAIFPDLQ